MWEPLRELLSGKNRLFFIFTLIDSLYFKLILFRPSGTEDFLRLYVEAETQERVDELTGIISQFLIGL